VVRTRSSRQADGGRREGGQSGTPRHERRGEGEGRRKQRRKRGLCMPMCPSYLDAGAGDGNSNVSALHSLGAGQLQHVGSGHAA